MADPALPSDADRRDGRGRLSSIDMLPEECDEDIAWANAELRERKMPQTEILRQFNARLADKGQRGVSKGAFSRYSVRMAIETRKIDASRQITNAVLERLAPGERSDSMIAAVELLKHRIIEMVMGEDEPDPRALGHARLRPTPSLRWQPDEVFLPTVEFERYLWSRRWHGPEGPFRNAALLLVRGQQLLTAGQIELELAADHSPMKQGDRLFRLRLGDRVRIIGGQADGFDLRLKHAFVIDDPHGFGADQHARLDVIAKIQLERPHAQRRAADRKDRGVLLIGRLRILKACINRQRGLQQQPPPMTMLGPKRLWRSRQRPCARRSTRCMPRSRSSIRRWTLPRSC